MKRIYISPSIQCIKMEDSLLKDTLWSGGTNRTTTGTDEPIKVDNNPYEPTDGGKHLGAKQDPFSDWDE